MEIKNQGKEKTCLSNHGAEFSGRLNALLRRLSHQALAVLHGFLKIFDGAAYGL